ncbi:hypothetical protein BD310DRAFT_589406 [Dichomitus squalens]|uniref:Uncharacterized protein n=1 Tax=Dichomitus squalens TaxID=114155 RepID=A0A4Q9PRI8_9APHY|nr:hypothetical protein BD310DRAFT_589406 [Dichomitus squalens]
MSLPSSCLAGSLRPRKRDTHLQSYPSDLPALDSYAVSIIVGPVSTSFLPLTRVIPSFVYTSAARLSIFVLACDVVRLGPLCTCALIYSEPVHLRLFCILFASVSDFQVASQNPSLAPLCRCACAGSPISFFCLSVCKCSTFPLMKKYQQTRYD